LIQNSTEAIELIKMQEEIRRTGFTIILQFQMTLISLMVHFGACMEHNIPSNQFVSSSSCLGKQYRFSNSVYIIDEGYMYTHEDLVANAGKTQEK
jgi:hypothetical protein